jgi:F420-dependent oxidoreductase-like protein
MKLSVYVGEAADPARCVGAVVDAERRGLHGAWLPQTLGIDPLLSLAAAAQRTERIVLGAGIVHIWPRHPVVLAQEALTLAELSAGRFELGVGIGHRAMVEETLGLSWEDPVGRTREVVQVVSALLRDGSVAFVGAHVRAQATLRVRSTVAPPVVVAALGERMCHMAGQVADGVMTWLAPASYVASTVAPAVAAGARAASRPAPRIIAAIPAACSDDVGAVRAGVRDAFGYMLRAPSYRAMLAAAGVLPRDADGLTAAAADAITAHGDEDAIHARARELIAAGADEVVLWPFPVAADTAASLRRTLDAMERIAAR